MKITVVGSASDNGFSESAQRIAEELGAEIARRGHTLLYGPERQMASLPYFVAKSAKECGAVTIAIANGSARTPFYDPSAASYVLFTDSSGGAGREVILVNSADGVISVGGGSGTLAEISIAYMNYIPVVAMAGSGGWSDRLAGQYLDERKKFLIRGATSPSEALSFVEELALSHGERPSQSAAPVFLSSASRRDEITG